MGIDLVLLPMEPDGPEAAFAFTTLEVERRSALWPLIRALPSQPVPPKFETLVNIRRIDDEEIPTLGNTQVDGYGEPLRCVFVRDLLPLATMDAVQDNWINRAIWAFLAEWPEDRRVAIFWS